MAIFLSSAFIFQTTVFAEGLCPNDELEVFNCQHTQKFASLCKKKKPVFLRIATEQKIILTS
ncbi:MULTISPECIES: hypothetical protein [unclassified Cupriavidus]|uniref:hypothetical protein n=1 Tax=unclassified Cupriavidus TaxID=2640874 RepID=UPI0012EBD78B|nr:MULTISPECIES: hypothetical protein [unclassified Cupriavidus]MBP0630868.1 hypothetical protein [Cupriavidus sp. AcVe19-1a]